jgi:N-methylhydantoinase A
MQEAPYRIAIDVGGTFTDVVLVDTRSGELVFGKVLSTPADPARGSLAGASEILEQSAVPVAQVRDLVHATTVATNAVLERRGAETALVTTAGFRDVLEMGREARYDIYDLDLRMPEPLVPRRLRAEVPERIAADGHVVQALDEAAAEAVLRALCADGKVEALAICLLHGYAHPEHERRLAALARRLFPDLPLSVSCEVAGEIREYERMSTTVVDAYVKPLVQGYVGRLGRGLRELGLQHPISIMLSHGGIGPAEEVVDRFPVRMIESGPAAGAIAACHIAREALERPDALAFDMGGTTAKISIVEDGRAGITRDYEVGHVHRFKRGSGLPLQISAVELLEIGAGGGSIARLNQLGLLTVGPQSAGAAPGPACYGRGGLQPTVTDADLLLGYLDPGFFLGGDMALKPALARRAIEETLAAGLGMGVEAIAFGIHDLVNEKMAAATRAHAAELGIDLRRFAMIAFGGAGPVHAYALARKLGIAKVICPTGAGVASAIGCLVAPPAIDAVTALAAPLAQLDADALGPAFAAMRAEAERVLAGLARPGQAMLEERSLDLRCEGQGYAVTVPLEEGLEDMTAARAGLERRFAESYQRLYGHLPPAVPLEVVALRSRIACPHEAPTLRLARRTGAEAGSPLKSERPAFFEAAGRFLPTPVLDRYRLAPGERRKGPAIVEERETSAVIGPDASFAVDAQGHLVIDLDPIREAVP